MDFSGFYSISWIFMVIWNGQMIVTVDGAVRKSLVYDNGVLQNQDFLAPSSRDSRPRTLLVDRLRAVTDSFVTSLYHDLALGQGESPNVFFSPLSIYTALFMAYAGATGETRAELGTLLCLNQDEIQATRDLGYTNDHFLRFISQVFANINTTNYDLNFANRFAVQSGLTVQPNYVQALRNFPNSDIKNYNFQTQPDQSRLDINAYVSNITRGKIASLLGPGTVDPTTVMILINAIYFKANWQYKFEESLTQDLKFFTKGDSAFRTVRMMSARRRMFYTYSRELKAQVVEIPYQSEELSMVVVLPRTLTGMDFTLKQFDAGKWKELQDTMDMRMVDLKLPKFKLETSYDLVSVLNSMGAVKLFSGADFSGMLANGGNVAVSAVVHKAFVEVNEKGTEAAAATGVVFSRSAVARPDDVKEFRADHPFLFAIRHNPTNLILFMGRVSDPSGSS